MYRSFSHDVTVAIFVYKTMNTAAVFVCKKHPVGIELFSQVKNFSYSKAADHVTENDLRYILFMTFSKLYSCFSYHGKRSGLL